jgi:hypothetical protein
MHDGSGPRYYRACPDHIDDVRRHHQLRGYSVDGARPLPKKEIPKPTVARVREALGGGPLTTMELASRLGVHQSQQIRHVRELARLAGAHCTRTKHAHVWTLP